MLTAAVNLICFSNAPLLGIEYNMVNIAPCNSEICGGGSRGAINFTGSFKLEGST